MVNAFLFSHFEIEASSTPLLKLDLSYFFNAKQVLLTSSSFLAMPICPPNCMMQSSYFGVNQLTVISTSTAFEEIFVNFPAYITFIIVQFEESVKLLLCRINDVV